MLRLTVVSDSAEETVVRVDGWLEGENVDVLRQVGTRHYEADKRLVLNLEGVKFIDLAGVALLRQWSGCRLILRNPSAFVQRMLASHRLDEQTDSSPGGLPDS